MLLFVSKCSKEIYINNDLLCLLASPFPFGLYYHIATVSNSRQELQQQLETEQLLLVQGLFSICRRSHSTKAEKVVEFRGRSSHGLTLECQDVPFIY